MMSVGSGAFENISGWLPKAINFPFSFNARWTASSSSKVTKAAVGVVSSEAFSSYFWIFNSV